MSQQRKQFMKPGCLSQKKIEYEMQRQKTIQMNALKLDAMGLKTMAHSLFGNNNKVSSVSTTEQKRKMVFNSDDEEYQPSEGEKDSNSCSEDDESFETYMNKFKHMTFTNKRGSCPTQHPGDSNRNQEERSLPKVVNSVIPRQLSTRQTHNRVETMAPVATQPTQFPTTGQPGQQLDSNIISHNLCKKRVRGPTRGKLADKMIKQIGRPIPVDINRRLEAIDGENSTRLSNALGEQIRAHVPVRKTGWKKVDVGIKDAIMIRVEQTFEIGDYKNDEVLRHIINKKCQELYSDWKCKLHKHYITLKEKRVPNPKFHPLHPCKLEDWVFMIDNVWETHEWKIKSEKAKLARSCVKYNHTSGSKSFLSRASIFVKKNNGREQPITEKFKETHIRRLDGEEVWINDKARQHHDEMVSKIVEQSQLDVTEHLSDEQLAMQILGKRSVYLKGRKNHKNISSSFTEVKLPDPEVIALRKQVDTFQSILQVLALKAGVDPVSIPGLLPNSEGEDDTFGGGHDTTFLG